METKIAYKSFNTNKTTEELQYNILQEREIFRNLILEQEFYTALLSAPIYKSQKLNLFETLEGFKSEIEKTTQRTKVLLNEIGMQLFQIDKKVECEDLLCDNFFIKEIDDLEYKIANFRVDITALKLGIFTYLQHVIIDN
jgi:hypothetical protein